MAGYLDPGDEVMLTDPALSLYTQTAEQIGARSVMVPTDASFHLDVGAMERAVTPKTRVVVLVNPSNPMGTACTREAMDGLANLVQRHDLLLVSDETSTTSSTVGGASQPPSMAPSPTERSC